jgi:hypothetical protein
MSEPLVQMRALRSLRIGTGTVLRGSVFKVLPSVAQEMLRSGAAVLVHESDLALLRPHVNGTVQR